MKNKQQYPSRESVLLRMISEDVKKLDNVIPADMKYLSDPMFMMRALRVNGDAIKYASRNIKSDKNFKALARLEKECQKYEFKISQLQSKRSTFRWPEDKVLGDYNLRLKELEADQHKLEAAQRSLYLEIGNLREKIRKEIRNENKNSCEAQ